MKRLTKNEFVEKMKESRVYLLRAKFEKEVDWDSLRERLIDFDERLDETNVNFINKNFFIWKKIQEVGATYIKFDNDSRLSIENSQYYVLLIGDYGVEYIGVRQAECTMIYAIEKESE